jgi:hypothetical protein
LPNALKPPLCQPPPKPPSQHNRPPRPPQVTNQADGARLLLALESKRRDALAPAAARLRGLLPPGALLGEQRDVTRLTERLAG